MPVGRRGVREWVLRRRGTTEQLSRRSWLLDIGLAAGLALVAILSHDQSDQPDFRQLDGPGSAPQPPLFPDPRAELADQTSTWDWAGPALLIVLMAAPLVFRRRYPLSTLWVVLLTATMVDGAPGRAAALVLRVRDRRLQRRRVQPVPRPGAPEPAGHRLPHGGAAGRRVRTGPRRGDQRGAAGRGPVPDPGADRRRRMGPAHHAGPRRRRAGSCGHAATRGCRGGPPRRRGGAGPDRAGAARRRDPQRERDGDPGRGGTQGAGRRPRGRRARRCCRSRRAAGRR